MTAGIYAARKKIDSLILTENVGGQVTFSGDIENYLGFQFITGIELTEKFREHVEKFSLELREGIRVDRVSGKGNSFEVVTSEGDIYYSQTVIIATGRVPRRLGVKGEEEFRNRGVTYCATCDAPLFAGKDVAVVGGGNAGLEAVIQLTRIARKIYLIEREDHLPGDPVLVEKVEKDKRVRILFRSVVEEIEGDKFVKGIRVKVEGEETYIPVEGVFVEIGSLPASGLVEEVKKNREGEIVVNCKCETNIPGMFAAGDVTNVFAKQIIVASGEGAKAALAVTDYLNRLK